MHWPVAAKETGRPDEAVALTVKSGSPNVLSASGPNEIVWPALPIANVRDTGVAGA